MRTASPSLDPRTRCARWRWVRSRNCSLPPPPHNCGGLSREQETCAGPRGYRHNGAQRTRGCRSPSARGSLRRPRAHVRGQGAIHRGRGTAVGRRRRGSVVALSDLSQRRGRRQRFHRRNEENGDERSFEPRRARRPRRGAAVRFDRRAKHADSRDVRERKCKPHGRPLAACICVPLHRGRPPSAANRTASECHRRHPTPPFASASSVAPVNPFPPRPRPWDRQGRRYREGSFDRRTGTQPSSKRA